MLWGGGCSRQSWGHWGSVGAVGVSEATVAWLSSSNERTRNHTTQVMSRGLMALGKVGVTSAQYDSWYQCLLGDVKEPPVVGIDLPVGKIQWGYHVPLTHICFHLDDKATLDSFGSGDSRTT